MVNIPVVIYRHDTLEPITVTPMNEAELAMLRDGERIEYFIPEPVDLRLFDPSTPPSHKSPCIVRLASMVVERPDGGSSVLITTTTHRQALRLHSTALPGQTHDRAEQTRSAYFKGFANGYAACQKGRDPSSALDLAPPAPGEPRR